MFNIGGGEVLVILLIALIVLGPDKLPNAARQAGKYLGDFRRMSTGFQRELRDAMDLGDLGDLVRGNDPKPVSPGGPTAQRNEPASAADAPDTIGPDAADSPVSTNGNGATGGAAANGSAPTDAAAASGADAPPAADPPAVRKRSIEVDGPSTSFD
jgi:sec-independent protein translocase protein TatB